MTTPPKLVAQLERHRVRALRSAQRRRDTHKWMTAFNRFYTSQNIWQPIVPPKMKIQWIKLRWDWPARSHADMLRDRYPGIGIAKRTSSRPLP